MTTSMSISQPLVPSTPIPSDSMPNSSSNASLLFDFTFCSAFDSITIYSGRDPSNSSAVFSRFCSNGNLPLIILPMTVTTSTATSIRDGMVIVFKSTSNSLLFDSKFELFIQTIFIPISTNDNDEKYNSHSTSRLKFSQPNLTSKFSSSSSSSFYGLPCDATVDVEQLLIEPTLKDLTGGPVRRSGSIALSLINYHLPITINSSCTLKFISNKPSDRIWLTITSTDSNNIGQLVKSIKGTSNTDENLRQNDQMYSDCSNSNSFEIYGQVSQINTPYLTHLNRTNCNMNIDSDKNLNQKGDFWSEKIDLNNHLNLQKILNIDDSSIYSPSYRLCEVQNLPVSSFSPILKGPTIASQLYTGSPTLSTKLPTSSCPTLEGYLSNESSMTFKRTFKSTPPLFTPFLLYSMNEITSDEQLASKLQPVNGFTLNYEFIDMKEVGDPIANTVCDRIINSVNGKSTSNYKGVIYSTRNTFLYARGSGRRHLTCSYELTNEQLYKVKIHFTSIRLSSNFCTTVIDPTTQMYTCSNVTLPTSYMSPELPFTKSTTESLATLSTLRVFDSINGEAFPTTSNSDASVTLGKIDRIQIACLCSSPPSPQASKLVPSQHVTSKNNYNQLKHMPPSVTNSLSDGSVDSDLIESSLLRDSVTFELTGPKITINLTILNMGPDDDFTKYGFDARYEYIVPTASKSITKSKGLNPTNGPTGPSTDHSIETVDSLCSSFVSVDKKHPAKGQLMINKEPLTLTNSKQDQLNSWNFWNHGNNTSNSLTGNLRSQRHQNPISKFQSREDYSIQCRYFIKSSTENSHLFFQFPSFQVTR